MGKDGRSGEISSVRLMQRSKALAFVPGTLIAGLLMVVLPASAVAAPCTKSDFEAVVDEAGGLLRDMNMKNKPTFQDKLRQLKDKRRWSHEAFLKEAAPFVQDDQIAVFDKSSEQLLDKISAMGQEGAEAKTPDCALLVDLRSYMTQLVEAQTKKWAYMFDKIDKELKK